MLGNWRYFLEKHLPFLLLLFWVALQWLFFMVYIFNTFLFFPSYFILLYYSSYHQGQRGCWATVCLSLAPKPADWEASVCIYILSSLRAPWGAKYGCLHCTTAEQISALPVFSGDRDGCAHEPVCQLWAKSWSRKFACCAWTVILKIISLFPMQEGLFLLLFMIRFCALLSLLKLAFREKIFLLSAPFNLNLSQLPLEVFAF